MFLYERLETRARRVFIRLALREGLALAGARRADPLHDPAGFGAPKPLAVTVGAADVAPAAASSSCSTRYPSEITTAGADVAGATGAGAP